LRAPLRDDRFMVGGVPEIVLPAATVTLTMIAPHTPAELGVLLRHP
jgi:hypothetical protein